jgi:hypothetical protein
MKIQRTTLAITTACALALGCAAGSEFATDMATALGEGAMEGFADYVNYQTDDQWEQSWEVSERGVGGVAARGVRQPDCSGVEDESLLYVGDLLHNPGSFVSTLDGSLDEAAYKPLEKAGFRLKGDEGGAIGVVKTTAGRYARFVLRWDERPHLHDLTVYDATGDAVLRFNVPMPLAPHALVNLDAGEPEGIDLLFGPAPDGRPTLAAGEGAALSFPLESICKG